MDYFLVWRLSCLFVFFFFLWQEWAFSEGSFAVSWALCTPKVEDGKGQHSSRGQCCERWYICWSLLTCAFLYWPSQSKEYENIWPWIMSLFTYFCWLKELDIAEHLSQHWSLQKCSQIALQMKSESSVFPCIVHHHYILHRDFQNKKRDEEAISWFLQIW